MRSSAPGGRFSINSEIDRYAAGIDEDLQRPVGGEFPWWRYNPETTVVDPIYDVGSSNGIGRQWDPPIMVKYLAAHIEIGAVLQNERGFYSADTLRATFNIAYMLQLFPDMLTNPSSFLKDRVQFLGAIYRPTAIYLRGKVQDRYTIVTMDMIQEHQEELVNDGEFD